MSDKDLQPVSDYIFDESKVNIKSGYYRFPAAKDIFQGPAPASYVKFSAAWCLQKREHPMVPCPENTPLPNRRRYLFVFY